MRTRREQEPGQPLHVIVRGNRRQNIFEDVTDIARFRGALLDASVRADFTLIGFCPMPNHAHVLLICGQTLVGPQLHPMLTSHALYMNAKYGWTGHLFEGPFKAFPGRSEGGLLRQLRYIHRNPLRAKLVDSLDDWPWSSHPIYAGRETHPGLNQDFALSLLSEDPVAARRLYLEFMAEEPADVGDAGDPLGILAARLERVSGSEAGVIAGPRRDRFNSELRKRFIMEALKGGSKVSLVAAYLGRSEEYVGRVLRGAGAQ